MTPNKANKFVTLTILSEPDVDILSQDQADKLDPEVYARRKTYTVR